MKTLFTALALLAATVPAAAAASGDAIELAKAKYAAAEYEEALSTLTGVAGEAGERVEVEQYRAFCLIALGRTAEAERAIAALVEADPRYIPSPSVASPKVLAMVAEMRRKELPAVARRLFDEGRSAFKEKQFARAEQQFGILLQVLDDEAMRGRPEAEDLRPLAEGFVTLIAAASAPPAAPAPATASAETPVATAGRVSPDVFVEPVAVSQEVPAWVPPTAIAGSRGYLGSIRVRIGADGRVKSAVIERATFPSYDARLVAASRNWVYKPATRNGQPVESERVIPVQLRPR